MNTSRAVTATFALQALALTLSTSGTGSGTISSSPAGIDCRATCTASFWSGLVHVLELRAALAEVYAARGRPAPTYTRATLAPGQMAMVVDVSELRAAVRALQPA